jgi:four helix bundle protein
MQYTTPHRLADEFHLSCQRLEIDSDVKNKVIAASATIPLNLSQAAMKKSAREQVRFFHYALASFNECKTLIDRSGYRNDDFFRQSDQLSTWLHRLVSGALSGRAMSA